MLAQYLDLTEQYAENNNIAFFETSNYDYALVQIIGSVDLNYFLSTLDSNAITSVSDGSIVSSTNYVGTGATDLSTGAFSSSVSGSGIFRFDVVGRYIQIQGEGPIGKLLVMLAKIS